MIPPCPDFHPFHPLILSSSSSSSTQITTGSILTMGRHSEVQAVAPDTNILHPEDSVVRKASIAIPHFASLSTEAQDATSKEHQMSLLQALKLYPKAVGWSILLSTAIVMEGYDVVLIASFYGLPTFNEKYGVLGADGKFVVPAPWKSGLSNGALCGEILGLFVNGIVSERYGYKKTMMGALAMMVAFIFIPFFSQNVQTLLVGEILCGIPWGVFQTLTVSQSPPLLNSRFISSSSSSLKSLTLVIDCIRI